MKFLRRVSLKMGEILDDPDHEAGKTTKTVSVGC